MNVGRCSSKRYGFKRAEKPFKKWRRNFAASKSKLCGFKKDGRRYNPARRTHMAAEQVQALTEMRSRADAKAWWLFSRRVDVSVFLGSAVVSLALLWGGARAGVLE